jgi:hypothetical protein
MNNSEIKRKAGIYVSQVVVLSMLLWSAFKIWGDESVQIPSLIGCFFTMTFYTIDGWLWYWVASRHHDYLPTFFTGTSGFRFLLALVISAIYYMVAGGSAMVTFLMVFLTYYLVLLIHHSIFFVRISNRS